MLWFVTLFLSLLVPPLVSQQTKQEGVDTRSPRIEVRIAFNAKTFRAADAMEVEVELANSGEESVFVGRRLGFQIDKGPYNFEILVKDDKGQEIRNSIWIADCVLPKKENLTKDDFHKTLARDWIALHPGEAFKTKVRFGPEFGGSRLSPGRYLVQGRYSSSGIDYLTHCHWMAMMKEEIRKLPYKSFAGIVDSNKVWITIRGE